METEANLRTDQAPSLHSGGEGARESSPPMAKERHARRLLHRLRGIAFAIAAFVLLVMVAGATYQFLTARADARRFPQEGKSVDVGGYKLNINCIGQGSPTVVLEAGLTVPAISWRSVQGGIARFTRVCSYDRAGYDWSDPGPMPRTTAQSVKELHTLLHNAGEKPPFVLVGHSFGGTNARIYNSAYPDEVAGMVLADTGHEDLKFPVSVQDLVDADLRLRMQDQKWARLLYWLGFTRFMARPKIANLASPFHPQEWSYFVIQPKFVDASIGEFETIQEGKAELRAAGGLGDKPLIVLIAGKAWLDIPAPENDKVSLHNSWVDFHKRLARLSSRGKWIIVPDTGHMIPIERPEAIVGAVQEVCADTRLP
jgi:pimeloyl-ACP methyl ester carboxylesterase